MALDELGLRLKLAARFDQLLRGLGASSGIDGLFTALAAAWNEPHRVYHGTTHLIDCLEQLDAAPGGDADRRVVEVALWFHDAVYEPRATGNETRSAAWASRGLAGVGVPPEIISEAVRLVLLTRHTTPASDPAGSLMCDVDLSILGREPEVYAEFERRIRTEYAWVDEPTYRAVRAEILTGFLRRSPLYLTGHFRRRYEAAAHRNLANAVSELRESRGGPASSDSGSPQ